MSNGRGRPVDFIGDSGGFLENFFRLPVTLGAGGLFPPPGRTPAEPPSADWRVVFVTLDPLIGVTPLMGRLSTVTHLSSGAEAEPLGRA